MERKKSLLLHTIIMILISSFIQAKGLKLIDQWKHDNETFGKVFYSLVDEEKNLVASFYKTPVLSMNKSSINKFAPHGQGPNELTNLVGICLFNGKLALAERQDKVKIFSKKENKYSWNQTLWFESSKTAHMVKSIQFIDNYWAFGGLEQLEYKNGVLNCSFLKISNSKGKIVKRLIYKKYSKPNQFYLMNSYLPVYKDSLFYLMENRLHLTQISTKKWDVVREIDLKKPAFYKPMPQSFYSWKKYNNPKDSFAKDMENWRVGYSRITHAVVIGDNLVLQIRTCNDQLKKFALLFYDLNNYELIKTIYTNDYLMGSTEKKLYCFANGNPGLDEDTDDCVINIYEIE